MTPILHSGTGHLLAELHQGHINHVGSVSADAGCQKSDYKIENPIKTDCFLTRELSFGHLFSLVVKKDI